MFCVEFDMIAFGLPIVLDMPYTLYRQQVHVRYTFHLSASIAGVLHFRLTLTSEVRVNRIFEDYTMSLRVCAVDVLRGHIAVSAKPPTDNL